MTNTFNPKALRARREHQRLSQDALGAQMTPAVTGATVCRWETGKQPPSKRNRDQLTRVLRCDLETLCRDPEATPSDEGWPFEPKVQFNRRLTQQIVNAFQLVSMKYGVSDTRVLELAPLLFTIAAEKSLKRRRVQWNEVWDMVESLQKTAPIYGLSFEDEEKLENEDRSIKERDVFGLSSYQEDVFESFVQNELRELGEPEKMADELSCSAMGIDYLLDPELAARELGLNPKDELEQQIARRIGLGDVDFKTACEKRGEMARPEYLQWLKQQIAGAQIERTENFKKFGREDDLDLLNAFKIVEGE